ncbi:MFS transporter [Novosphingobium sp. FSY-8]|uniref:MFS transporter n=1 Tax=Novosphingobium ovatum TaxID=1908523 RepID=A0ABW9XA88_9SPHN|nr:MFS transporter [Novosphingobium ovatum]NBC35449.1 MFS transporter [Novosphingobium ovatum]
MAAYWLAQFAAWLALLTPLIITIALKLSLIAGEAGKAQWLGLILGVGAALAMVSAPVWGVISDRTTWRWGRRKPWVAIGSLALLAGLVVMAMARTPLVFGLGWLICQIGSNAAQAALNAVMSDIVPENQHGVMSALLGASMTAAMVCGVFLTQYTEGSSLAMFVVPWLVSIPAVLLFLWVVPDSPADIVTPPRVSLREIFGNIGLGALRHHDFAWAFASRFLVVFGAAFSLTYQVFYLTDHLHVPQAQVAAFMVTSTSLMGSLTFAISCVGGWISDRVARRKPFVGLAAVMMAIGLLLMALATSFDQFLIAAALISIGQGLYYAVDIALCVEVLPDRAFAARDMAVLQIANSLPQSLAPTIAPVFLGLALGGLAGQNYPALFAFASMMALVGAMAILPIRKVR